jgi:hypothetical protein
MRAPATKFEAVLDQMLSEMLYDSAPKVAILQSVQWNQRLNCYPKADTPFASRDHAIGVAAPFANLILWSIEVAGLLRFDNERPGKCPAQQSGDFR